MAQDFLAEAISADEPKGPSGKKKQSQDGQSTPQLDWYDSIQAGDVVALKKAVGTELSGIIAKRALVDYEILFLFDDLDNISYYHLDRLYAAASSSKDSKKDVLLVLQSPGGRIEPAYLISKTLKRLSSARFVVAVPRQAKSAATLIALGADEIHMGLISQLGPIDPQLYGVPALALGNALDLIADLTCRFPAAAEMFTKYLADQIPIRILGYHQRVGESAAQYAERLLAGKLLADGKTAESVAKHLVHHYKDHDFVIDCDEAKGLLGNGIVKQNSNEYQLADDIYNFLDMVGFFLRQKNLEFWHVGSTADGFVVREKKKDTKTAGVVAMVDDRNKRDFRDKTRINMKEPYEVAYWKRRFGVPVSSWQVL